jgi:hypothetical protein
MDMRQSVMPETASTSRGWWYVLVCLPFAYFVQLGFLLSLSREGGAMADAALWIDIAIFVRSIIGLIWQPRHRDWRIYLAALFVCIPVIWGLKVLWALVASLGF